MTTIDSTDEFAAGATVQRVELDQVDAFGTMAAQFRSRDHIFLVTGRDEALRVLSETDTFSMSALPPSALYEAVGQSLSLHEGEDHRRLRALVEHAFRPTALQRWRTDFIEPLAQRLIDGFIADGYVEFNRQFAMELPVQVIARILGLPLKDYPAFRSASFDILAALDEPERALAASRWIKERVAMVLEEGRRGETDGLIRELATVTVDGQRLSNEEIFDIVVQIIIAGNETTYHNLGSLVFALLTHPDQLALVLEDRSLIPRAVEEALRWAPPAAIDPRAVCQTTMLGGHLVQAGDIVLVSLAAANRDERYFEDPDRFWIMRPMPRPHLAFAAGPHFCLGAHLARLELEVSLRALFDRLTNIRINPAADPQPSIEGGVRFRGPNHLPLLFEPVA